MTQHGGFLAFLANSRRKFEKEYPELIGHDPVREDQMEPLVDKGDSEEEDEVQLEYEELLKPTLHSPEEQSTEMGDEQEVAEESGDEQSAHVTHVSVEEMAAPEPPEEEHVVGNVGELEETEVEAPAEADKAEVQEQSTEMGDEQEVAEEESGDEQSAHVTHVSVEEMAALEPPEEEHVEGNVGELEETEVEAPAEADKAEVQEQSTEMGDEQAVAEEESGDEQSAHVPVEAVEPLEPAILDDPLGEPLEGPLDEEESEEPYEVGDMKEQLARRRKRLESQLFATGKRRKKADGWPKQEVKAEPKMKKEIQREAAAVKRELGQGTPRMVGASPGSLLKRRRRGPNDQDEPCEAESPMKQGRVLRGLPRTDLLQMAGHLERRYLCGNSLAVAA